MTGLVQKFAVDVKSLISSCKSQEGTRVLAIDFGEKKLGLALTDPTKTISSPFSVLKRTNIKADINNLRDVIRENNVSGILFGMPFELDGSMGRSAQLTLAFAEKLLSKKEAPIAFIDERYSTSAVNRDMIAAGVKRKKRDAVDDKLAASYLLQIALDMI